MENTNEAAIALRAERLKKLEYEIRKSITVREDQEEDVELMHREEAARCGIPVENLHTKGDLLNAVQTTVRLVEANAGKVHDRS